MYKSNNFVDGTYSLQVQGAISCSPNWQTSFFDFAEVAKFGDTRKCLEGNGSVHGLVPSLPYQN